MDPRIRRSEQALTALVLAAGFAFGARWLVTLWTVVLAITVVAEPIAPVRQALASAFARLGPPRGEIDPRPIRFATILAVALLTIATVVLWVGPGAIGWMLVLAVAASAALSALTHLCLGCEVYALLRRRNPRTAK